MYRTFNMGLGFILVVDPAEEDKIIKQLDELNEEYYLIGEVIEDEDISLEFI